MSLPLSTYGRYSGLEPVDSMSTPELYTNDYSVDHPTSITTDGEMPHWSVPDIAISKWDLFQKHQQYTQHALSLTSPNDRKQIQHLSPPNISPNLSSTYRRDLPSTIHYPTPSGVPLYTPHHQPQVQSPIPMRPVHPLRRPSVSYNAYSDIEGWRSPAAMSSNNVQFPNSTIFVPQTQGQHQAHTFSLSEHPQLQPQQQLHYSQPPNLAPYSSHASPLLIRQAFEMQMSAAPPDANMQYHGHSGDGAVYTPTPHPTTSNQGYTPNIEVTFTSEANPMSAVTHMHPPSKLAIPVPVPNLTKKSRGRRVPTVEDIQHMAVQNATETDSRVNTRAYKCDAEGCEKLFARGEHLRRHIRSIHTHEKREFSRWRNSLPTYILLFFFASAAHMCPYCGKHFSRHDNLAQHVRGHED